jgi:formamidopyrimidine-DNA glycosylase
MPELPEVETIRRILVKNLLSQKLTGVKIVNKKFCKKQGVEELSSLTGQKLQKILRKGKYLIFLFETEGVLFHLGLTGALIFWEKLEVKSYKHLILVLEFERKKLAYIDIRKFGRIKKFKKEEIDRLPEIINLGKDALEVDLEEFQEIIKKQKTAIKSVLLNQKLISGLGNIYTDEILFRAGISPLKKGNELNPEEVERLFKTMKEVLKEAIKLRGSSVRDYIDPEGRKGEFQKRHMVYGKKGELCPKCKRPLVYKKIAQRGTTFCPHCQI